MAGVGPAQELLAREIRDAGGGDELAAGAGALDQGGVRPTQQAAGIIGEGCGRGERRPDERCTPPRLQTVADDIADDQHGGILRPLSHQVEVAADLFGGGQERRGKLQAGTLGQLGRGERIPDRAQILQLMLGQPQGAHAARRDPRRALRLLREGARSASPGGALGHPSRGCRAVGRPPRSAASEALGRLCRALGS